MSSPRPRILDTQFFPPPHPQSLGRRGICLESPKKTSVPKQMATQDISLYVRAKDAERRHGSQRVGFMKDGFQQWAESERPARGGGEPKSPLHRTNDMRHTDLYATHTGRGMLDGLVTKTKYSSDVPAGAKKALATLHKKMTGGLSPQEAFDAAKVFVENIIQVYNDVKDYMGPVKALLKSDALMNLSGGKYKPVLTQVVSYLDMLGFGHARIGDDESESDEEDMGSHRGRGFSFGKVSSKVLPIQRLDEGLMKADDLDFSGRGMYGVSEVGTGLPPPLHAYLRKKYSKRGGAINFEKAKEIAGDVVKFFKDNKAFIHAILESDAINSKVFAPPKDYPRKFAQGLSMLGLGKGGVKLPGLPEYEDCPEGYVDDGLLCRKPLKWNPKARKGLFGEDIGMAEGGEIIPKKMKGNGVSISGLKSALSGVADKIAAAPSIKSAIKKVTGGRGPSRRGEIVRKVMREQGLSLPQASKYVKDHGLY